MAFSVQWLGVAPLKLFLKKLIQVACVTLKYVAIK